MRNVYTILVGKLEERRPFGRHRHRWEDNIKVRYEVFTAVKLLIMALWVVTLSGLGCGYRRFGRMYRLHLYFSTDSL
jgi:hypothetical protein